MRTMPHDEDTTVTWPTDMNHDALAGVGEDDFTKFLDLENGFDTFQQQITHGSGHTALETPMGRLAFGQTPMPDMTRFNTNMMQQMDMSMNGTHMSNYNDLQQNDDQQQYQQYQMYEQMNPSQHFQVPPTPVSAEMHAAKYMSQVENAGQLLFERNQASFTPLVSPAQTPLDHAWNMPDYVVADDFFSPLTSPAIEAQPTFASTNATASPVDLSTDLGAIQTSASSGRRGRRKAQQPSTRNPARSVRQSPAMKPQTRRRQFSINALPLDKIESMLEIHAQGNNIRSGTGRMATFASSGEESLSPEPVSEVLMRPPPVPSNIKSPALALNAQSKDVDMPATPAMLMRMPGKQTTNTSHPRVLENDDVMEDIALPDAAAALPQQTLSSIVLKGDVEDEQDTPTIAAKTSHSSANSTPKTSAMRVATPASSVDKAKRPDVKTGGRGNKKRPNIPSAAISPALRPKISPSISPLVPLTATGTSHLSAETSALYLASKSNYQNILDGTHLPGVSYPEALAENLSSKRTSHKIAEQGRRNRINVALKEIEGLLPPSIITHIKKEKGAGSSKENDDASPDGKGGGGQGASKASTVEMAIVYIKSLQAELQVTKKRLEMAEKTIAEANSSGSQGSESGNG